MLADPSPQIRIGGATGLAGISSEQTRQALKAALGDSNAQVRLTSAWALWRLGDLDDATSALSKALGSSQDTVRQGAVRVLLRDGRRPPLPARGLGRDARADHARVRGPERARAAGLELVSVPPSPSDAFDGRLLPLRLREPEHQVVVVDVDEAPGR